MVRQLKHGGNYYYQFIKNGKRYNGVCTGCTTKRAAEAFEKKLKDTVDTAAGMKSVKALVENFRDELTGGKTILLSEAFELYLKKPTKRQPGDDQIARNRSFWQDFLAFMSNGYADITSLADVTRQHAEEYISLLRTTGVFDKTIQSKSSKGCHRSYTTRATKLAPRTINKRHKAIKTIFSRLKDDAGMLNNPFDIPTMDNDTTSREAFSDDELKLIGEKMSMPYTRPIFTIGLCTGLTLGDICLLKWSEISENWITNKRRHKTKVKLEIPILPPLAAFLDEQRRQPGYDENGFVVPELAEMYQKNPSGIHYRVRQFLASLGIQTKTQEDEGRRAVSTKAAHAMRHTFAYLAGVYNIPQPIVQGVLGHLSPEMTALYQRHALREQKAKFFQQMPNVLGVSSQGTALLLEPESDPERIKLKQMADALPLERVKEILALLEAE